MKHAFYRAAGTALCLLLALPAAGAPAAAVDVGWRERAEIRVPDGETAVQDGRVSVDPTGRLYKTGGGELVLPTASVVQAAPLEIGVLGGTLTLRPGGDAPEVPRPAFVDSRAALWLDASSANLLVTNGAPYRPEVHGNETGPLVSEWLDARATDASDARYLRATPIWWTGTGSSHLGGERIPPAVVEAYGKRGVWFGGVVSDGGTDKTSGQSLLVKNSAQATDDLVSASGLGLEFTAVQNVLHVFAVQAVSNWWGRVLGNYGVDATTGGTRDFNSVGKTSGSILEYGGNAYRSAMDTGRMAVDGVPVDPWTDNMGNHRGLHLLEFELTDRPAQFHAIFRDSTQSATAGLARNGGDYLYELVVFTNRLTEAQVSSVRAWLLDKWDIPRDGGAAPAVRLEGGSLAVDSAEPFTASVAGAGTVANVGAGALVLPYSTNAAFTGAVDVRSGSAVLQGADVAVAVADGDALSVASGQAGDEVAKAAGADGSLAKAGRGRATVRSVPATAASVAVSGGVLRLAPTVAADPAAVDSVVAEPDDPSFEAGYATNANILKAGNGRVSIAAGKSTANGWLHEDVEGAYNAAVNIYNHYTCTAAKFSSWPAPDGIVVMYVKGEGSQVTATVKPTADGVYEFSFFASARQGYLNKGNRNHLEFWIGEDESSMAKFGELVKSDSPYYRLYYRTPRLTGGKEYKLRISSRAIDGANVDGTVDFDDIRLRLVPDSEIDTAVVAVPNGDFEETDDTLSPIFNAANKTAGWDFVADAGSWSGSPGVALVDQGVSAYARDYNTYNGTKTSPYVRAFYSWYECFGPNVFGFAQLCLASNAGVARVTFTPPAGTWRVRVDAAKRQTVAFNGANMSQMARLQASVSVGGGSAVSLGTPDYVRSHHLAPLTFPDSFTVDGSQPVTLSLRQERPLAVALVDNVVLVPVADDGELVKNGSFEDCTLRADGYSYSVSGWAYANNGDASVSGYSSSAVWETHDRAAGVTPYGTNVVDGVMRAKIRGRSEIYQNGLSLAPGFYRLRFWAESRHANGGAADTRYGRNPIRAYLTQGTTTNDIGWTYVDSSEFVGHSFLFRVAEAGTYTLHLQGMSEPGSDWWGDGSTANDRLSHVDLVSLKAVSEEEVPETVPGLSENAVVSVAKGARLELEFSGTQKVAELRLGGRRAHGVVSAATHPDYLSGPGSFYAPEQAFVLIVK